MGYKKPRCKGGSCKVGKRKSRRKSRRKSQRQNKSRRSKRTKARSRRQTRRPSRGRPKSRSRSARVSRSRSRSQAKSQRMKLSGVGYGSHLTGTTYYFYHGGGSHKFWAGKVSGNRVYIHHGRIGYGGRVSLAGKPFASAAEAHAHLNKVKREKLSKGYRPGRMTQIFDRSYSLRRSNPCHGERWKNP